MRHGIVVCAFVLAAGLLLSGDLDAGNLEPPGPPAPTMKTIDQLEPRTPISSLPITIAAPGSYYLTRNLTGVSGQSGITITASFVTLDLNGFSLIGVGGSVDGIRANVAGIEHVVIRNGVIRGWGALGISASAAIDVHVEHVQLDGNVSNGLVVGSRSIVRDTSSTGSLGTGIEVGGASTIIDCTAGSNSSRGFVLGAGSVVSGSTAANNGGDGFQLYYSGTATECTALQNGTGFYLNAGSRVVHSVARQNAVGISAGYGASIEQCTAYLNTDDGIRLLGRNLVRGNVAQGNANDGIHATMYENRIEDNEVTENGTGIRVDSTNNLVVKNSLSFNNTEYVIGPGNKAAPFSTDPTTAGPWANFDL